MAPLQLLWLAWGNCKYEVKDILDAWRKSSLCTPQEERDSVDIESSANVPGEEAPTKIAIQHKIQDIRKGVRDYGVASFFSGSTSTPRQSRRPKNGQIRRRTALITTTENGIDSKSTTLEQVTSTTSIKPEDNNETILFTTDATAATYLDLDSTTFSDRRDLNGRERSAGPNDRPDTVDGNHDYTTQFLSPATKKSGQRLVSGTAANSNTRKRRHSDFSDSASMTTETTQSEISITAPEFDMKLRPDHRSLNLHESDGERFDAGTSDGSDGTWVPGVEEGKGRRKRVRRF